MRRYDHRKTCPGFAGRWSLRRLGGKSEIENTYIITAFRKNGGGGLNPSKVEAPPPDRFTPPDKKR
jgi:hypothetical protein